MQEHKWRTNVLSSLFNMIRMNSRSLIILNGATILFLFMHIYDVTTQLNNPALLNWAVHRDEVLDVNATKTEYIPKIIHQTYKTSEIPENWKGAQQSVIDMSPDYTYILWTDETAREFIATEYPWFLNTFDNYPHPIMRADAIRYFVLYHYGGFYLDMDAGLRKPLDELRQFPSVFYKTKPTGVSNDFMGSAPMHPFMKKLITSISKYSGNYLLPYFTVMYSTGPLFLSVVLQRYNFFGAHKGKDATRILLNRASEDSVLLPLSEFVYHVKGSTWHQGDAGMFTYIAKHLAVSICVCSLLGIAAFIALLYVEVMLFRLVSSLVRHRRKSGYQPIVDEEERFKLA